MTAPTGASVRSDVALTRADVMHAAMTMCAVVPIHEERDQWRGWGRCIAGNRARYVAVRNSVSTKASASLTRGREYDGLTSGQFSIASTVVTLSVDVTILVFLAS